MRNVAARSARRNPVCLAASLLLFVSVIPGVAATDTLRTYEPGGHHGAFTDASIPKCVQRIGLPAGTRMTSVSIMLDGPKSDHACDIVVYGHEGGLLAPRLERAAFRAHAAKYNDGIETITVQFDEPYVHAGGQCFVSIEGRRDDVRLVTDMVERTSPCTEASGQRRMDQLVQSSGGTWSTAPFGFIMDVVVEMPDKPERGFVRDTMLDDARDKRRSDIRYISATDIDGDGRLDFSAAGMLYMNGPSGITPIDIVLEDKTATPYAFFLDANGDGRMEVAAMNGKGDNRLRLYTAGRSGTLTRYHDIDLTMPLVPMSMSVGDIDNDGAEDILLGGMTNDKPMLLALRRNGAGTWQAAPWAEELITGDDAPITMIDDLDRDGRLDVLLRTGNSDHIVRMVDGGNAWSTSLTERAESRGMESIKPPLSAWVGWDREREAAILRLPPHMSWQGARSASASSTRTLPYSNASIILDDADADAPRYEERLNSVVYADLDNDGEPEQLRFSRGLCRYLSVFRKSNSIWEDVTSAWGLDGLDDCDDGIVCDLDGDGRQDLIVDRRGKVEVYHNRLNVTPGHRVRLSATPHPLAGATIETRAVGRLTYVSGRGRLMQDPPEFVLPPTTDMRDTATIYWPGDKARKERTILPSGERTTTLHQVTTLHRGASAVATEVEAPVRLDASAGRGITITTREALENASLSVMNLVGETLFVHPLGNLASGATVLTMNEFGKTLITGTYVVRLQWERGESVSVLRIIR